MYDLIILGGGPAGLTAASYAIRKRLNVLLISPDLGGKTGGHMYLPDNLERFQVINGDEVISRFKSQIEFLDFARKLEHCEKVEALEGGYVVHTRAGGRYETKALIVATGAIPVRMNVPGESEYRLRGLSYSAVSYAPLFIDRTAAIVGEGELGLQSALELAQVAQKVFYVVPSGQIPEGPKARKLLASPKVTMMPGYKVKEVKGAGGYHDCLSVTNGQEEQELGVDVTFVELGLKPNSDCVANLVDLNEKGQIIVDCSTKTSRPGIFAAGDVTDTFAEQVLICIGEGAKAALAAYEYILSLE